jgi:hypothetical protein
MLGESALEEKWRQLGKVQTTCLPTIQLANHAPWVMQASFTLEGFRQRVI